MNVEFLIATAIVVSHGSPFPYYDISNNDGLIWGLQGHKNDANVKFINSREGS